MLTELTAQISLINVENYTATKLDNLPQIAALTVLIYKNSCMTLIQPTKACIVSSILSQEHHWSMHKANKQLNFKLLGVLRTLLAPLAKGRISVLAVSSFYTDYILIKNKTIDLACDRLKLSDLPINAKNEGLTND